MAERSDTFGNKNSEKREKVWLTPCDPRGSIIVSPKTSPIRPDVFNHGGGYWPFVPQDERKKDADG
jgi:hypothetical protein